MLKSPEAFRTISEVAETLDVPPHVLRFWETRFAQVKPVKRGGGRRYYRPEDVRLLRGIRGLLYDDGMTIKGVQKILRERGVRHVIGLGTVDDGEAAAPVDAGLTAEVEEFEVEDLEIETEDADRSEPGPAEAAPPAPAQATPTGAGPADAAPAHAPSSDAAAPRPVSQADLFTAPTLPAAAPVPADTGTGAAAGTGAEPPRPTRDKAALRALIGRLEALRAVMVEGRGA